MAPDSIKKEVFNMANCTCIKLKTLDQRLTVVQQPVLASGDVGTVHVEYELDSYWEGYTPSGTFYTGKQPENIYEQPLVGGVCVVPWEVLQEDGVLYIGLRGVDQAGRVKTAAPVRYRIEKGSPCGAGTTSEPTPDVYQQILAVAGAAYDKAQSVEERADAGDFNPSATTISELVVAELANRGQLNSEFVQSTEEMKDPTKLYILPDMHIYGARKYEVQGEPLFTNLADPTDGNWVGDRQLTEEGQVVAAPGHAVTNILELNAVADDVIRIRGLGAMGGFAHTLCLGEDGTTIKDASVPAKGASVPAVAASTPYRYKYDADTGEVLLHVLDRLPVGGIEIYKFRTSGKLTGTAADVVITLNEPIKYAVAYEYEWYDTGKRADGQEGPAGPAGPAGADGQTPQRGVDYWTYDDKREIVTDAVDAVADYLTTSSYATHEYVDEQIATFDFIKVMGELPAEGLPNRIYLVPKTDTQTQDLFDEWVWVNKGTEDTPQWGWEWVTTKQIEVDLTPYATKEYADTVSSNSLKKVYPIGSIYLTMSATNPTELFGFGEWTLISNRFLVGAGDLYEVGATGGEATHTLTIEEMPSHLHKISSSLQWVDKTGNVQGGTNTYYKRSESQTTQLAGGDQPHNNMPPYIAVYMWQRTA